MTANIPTSDAFIATIEEFESFFHIRQKLCIGDKKENKLDPFLDSRFDAIIKAPYQSTDLKILLMRIDRLNKLRSVIWYISFSSRNNYDDYHQQLDGLLEALGSDLAALLEQPKEQVSDWQHHVSESID